MCLVINIFFDAQPQFVGQPIFVGDHQNDAVLIICLEHDEKDISLLDDAFQGNVICSAQLSQWVVDVVMFHECDGDWFSVSDKVAEHGGYDGVCRIGRMQM